MSKEGNQIQAGSNRVLQEGARTSKSFFESDRIFRAYIEKHLSLQGRMLMDTQWKRLGEIAAVEMDELSMLADKKGPELVKRDRFGETIDEIRFHPAYDRLMEIAVDSGMMRVKWHPEYRNMFPGELHALGFGSGYLFAMGESGQYCPLCMTDGVARLVDRFASEEDQERLLPRIATEKPAKFFTGAMFLTEKAGGSDVGANLVKANHLKGTNYELSGEKWFCSNVNADIIFALARTDENRSGTKGLSIFLIEKQKPDGSRNPLGIVRLKDKLGVRSMASAECLLDGTVGKLIGDEFDGFRIMAEMINLSRLYNSVAALSGGRRALAEAYQFLYFRNSFGKIALDHALVRSKLWELGSLHLANFYMVWRTIRALDAADAGDKEAGELVRVLTPMTKRESAEIAVYLARESMELMGGMGYIEDTVMPKIMRDLMVLPIWEGAGNIMILDMIRAAIKSNGLTILLSEIKALVKDNERYGEMLTREAVSLIDGIQSLVQKGDRETLEFQGKRIFLDLTRVFQCALLIGERDQNNGERIDLALRWLMGKIDRCYIPQKAPTREAVENLIGWEF